MKKFALLFLWAVAFFCSQNLLAASKEPTRYEDKDILMRLVSRTSEQLAAFYIGRGFNQAAIKKIQETCFVSVIIKNKHINVLWLELDNWTFAQDGVPITRIKRNYWKERWQEVNLAKGHQATFGWTLMPEVRDLRIDESVGGNIVLPKQTKPFTMTAYFKTGPEKNDKPKKIVFENVTCKNK